MWAELAEWETETQTSLWSTVKLLVSHGSSWESALETSRPAALFPLWPLSHRQRSSVARRVALPGVNT